INTIAEFTFENIRDRVCILLLHNDTPVGIIAAAISQHPIFRKVKLGAELLWYVTPEHRGKHSMQLVDAFEEWAWTIGLRKVSLSHYNDTIGDKLQPILEAKGYELIEKSYVKELK